MRDNPIIEIKVEKGGHTAEITITTFDRDENGIPQNVRTEHATASVEWNMGPDGNMLPSFSGWMTPKTEPLTPEAV